jgi:ABC-type sugar transport system ATPase subunit
VIALKGVSIRAGSFTLPPATLAVATGEYAVLMGRTGCGKTTLLEAVAGLRPVESGAVELMGRDVTDLRPAERNVGYVPQDLALFPSLTVRDHLAFALEVRGAPAARIAARVAEMADLLGIAPLLPRLPAGLSGGEAQRVALGRALAAGPPVLLLDEPLSALDEDTRGEMIDLLKMVQRHERVTALHVTHGRAEARALADRLFVLDGGRLREEVRDEGGRELSGAASGGGGPGQGRDHHIRPGDGGVHPGPGGGG